MQNFPPEDICLFLDVDGTLVDLAPRPQDVIVPPALVVDLVRATQRLGGGLALVSGRSIETIDRLFHPLRPCAAGVHGAELRLACNGDVRRTALATLPVELRRKLDELARRFAGTIVEDKGASVALHYRFCADRRIELLAAMRAQLAQQQDASLVILPGHFVFDVKRDGYDKGTAVAAFMQEEAFRERKPVMIGDDVTDEPAFRIAIGLGGYAFSVGRDVEGVSGRFEEPKDVRRWLARIANADPSGTDGHEGLARTG